MEISTDPYEQKLYHMFRSYDTDSVGSLDQPALLKLCNSLELNDKGNVLVRSLFTKCDSRVTFKAFKEALLDFLGTEMQETKNADDGFVLGAPDSPGREVSPKLIMGNKKYGRRSRPQSLVSNSSDSDSETENIAPSFIDKRTQKVQRSSSQSEIQARRRRPNSGSKLKRCASLPAQKNPKAKEANAKPTEISVQQSQLASSVESLGNLDFENLSHTLFEIWTSYGNELGTNYLNRAQLETVCERVGLHKIAGKVADEVFEKLNLDIKQKICFADFIGLIQGDTDGVTISTDRHLNATDITTLKGKSLCNIKDSSENDLHADRDIPCKLEMISANDIIEMWEAAGIAQPKKLFRNLGFESERVNISQLSNALEEELRGLHSETQVSPLLKASLVLRKAEVIALHQAFRQLVDENKKLHADNRDANRRVALLAQEIDERHATLEDKTKSEIRMLEQRHAEIVRELTSQLATDRENWSNLNVRLELRIKNLEQDENKLKSDLQALQNENSALENEQASLQKQITDLLESNIKLNNELMELEDRQRNDDSNKDQKETEEVLELIDKITSLQIENASLRDKNDELVAEIECLNNELSKLKNKKISSSRSNLDVACDTLSDDNEHSSLGVKRRGDSPSKTRIPEESPRLGKLRKCNNDNSESEASGEWVALNSELNTLKGESNELNAKALSNSIDSKENELKSLKGKVSALEKELNEYKKSSNTSQNVQTVISSSDMPVDLETLKSEKEKFEIRCQELENSLEQMRKEYEDCEDYWQSKLGQERQTFEEERQIYLEEQQESDKKFTELMQKVREYEEQFNKEGRLSPIEEKDSLEQQYADLEAEAEEIRENARKIFKEKTKEIEDLQQQVKELREKLGENLETSSNNQLAVDTVDLASQASSPISYLWNQSTIQVPARDYQNPNWNVISRPDNLIESSTTSEITVVAAVEGDKVDSNEKPHISPIQKPNKTNSDQSKDADETASVVSAKSLESNTTSSSSRSINKSSTRESSCASPNIIKEELKRLKMVEVQLKEEIKELALKRDGLVMELQQLHEAKPVLEKAYARASHPSLLQRVHQLEQKNRHLQSVLKQQQHYTESIMHQTWQQQRSEIAELRNRIEAQGMIMAEQNQRLASADILVKDLYVENSHLSATIQRLEQQRSRANLLHQHQGVSGVPGLP